MTGIYGMNTSLWPSVALAGVLAMEPRVLLLEVLVELPQEMIVVTHNEPFMHRLETRRVVMGS